MSIMKDKNNPDTNVSEVSLLTVFKAFFRLGLVAFGGPAAHISMMEAEFVRKRNWISTEAFLDLVAAANLIPGPNSTETVMHLGYRVKGYSGLLAAGLAFIIPAAGLTLLVAWLYLQGNDLESARPLLFGIQGAVLSIIAIAVWKLGKKAAKEWVHKLLVVLATLLAYMQVNEVLIILGGGMLFMIYQLAKSKMLTHPLSLLLLVPGFSSLRAINLASFDPSSVESKVSLVSLGLIFLKTGAILFGSGYVLIAYLEADLVNRLGWMTQAELLDAIAMGQFTPGPVLTTSTFIGFTLAGIKGAGVATAAIFLPSFVFVALTAPLIDKMRKVKWASYFLAGASASAVGVMLAVLFELGQQMSGNHISIITATLSLALLWFKPSFSTPLLVILAALLGLLLSMV